MIRRATFDDIPALIHLMRKWPGESPLYAAEVCEDTGIATLNHLFVEGNNMVGVVAEVDGKVVGLHFWSKERYFTKRPYGCMFILYVHPDHRRGAHAADMVRAALEDCADCFGFYATSTAAFSDSGLNARAFSIMLRRVGFVRHGDALFWGKS